MIKRQFIKEAEGTYKDETIYILQIKHKKSSFYQDNISTKILDTDLNGLKEYSRTLITENLDLRIIKRTVKEDVIND